MLDYARYCVCILKTYSGEDIFIALYWYVHIQQYGMNIERTSSINVIHASYRILKEF